MNYGPTTPIAIWADTEKYRQLGETFEQKCNRIAQATSDDDAHFRMVKAILKDQRFLPGGRIQNAVGSARATTAFNCFVMQQVPDDLRGIMDVAKDAAITMQLGGGVGYDFSAIRPKGSRIKSLGSQASGPVSFMDIFNSTCKTIASAGHRRGAQMACLRIDHPDIIEYVTSKTNADKLNQFNISVLVTDAFMEAVMKDEDFDLVFEGKVHSTVRASYLWDIVLRSTWDWAEPGVIFIDRVNKMNNLWYIEDISATNPCGEQPLPPYGACLLGSFNWVKYCEFQNGEWVFNTELLKYDLYYVIRMMDNVIDETIYALPEQEKEAKNKRRMGLGHTGVANALNRLGYRYGSERALAFLDMVFGIFANTAYKVSASLAAEKGPFPAFNRDMYLKGEFIRKLDDDTKEVIFEHGVRNSHLLSIAPTGTISLTADNVSSGIEPVFSHEYERTVITPEGPRVEKVLDYGYRVWDIEGETVDDVSVDDHINTLIVAQKWTDSAVSKTCNIGNEVKWDEFKEVYMKAYLGGAKGCTTFRSAGKRFGILNASASEDIIEDIQEPDETIVEGGSCYIDIETGIRTCDE